jgi:hypothetical protein
VPSNEIVVSGISTFFNAPEQPPTPGGGAGFVIEEFGSTLLVTTRGEYAYIHLGTTIARARSVDSVTHPRTQIAANGAAMADDSCEFDSRRLHSDLAVFLAFAKPREARGGRRPLVMCAHATW